MDKEVHHPSVYLQIFKKLETIINKSENKLITFENVQSKAQMIKILKVPSNNIKKL